VQSLPSVLQEQPLEAVFAFVLSREISTLHAPEHTVSVFNTATVNDDGLLQEGLLLPTREEVAEQAFNNVRFWMEEGHSQLLSREQALEIAAWGLKIAGYSDLQHQVLAELVVLPEEALQPL
jgi:hypothetical protein